MRIDVLTIFPPMVEAFAAQSLLGKAQERGLLDVRVHDLRAGTDDPHRSVDDAPFGGGAGMVLRAEPLARVVEAVDPPRPLLLLGPGGRRLDQDWARELASGSGFSLLCGRYEDVDHRVRSHVVDGEMSIGDYVLAGGEVATLVVIEAVTRLLPGVLGNATSATDDSFSASEERLLEPPVYTRPPEIAGRSVPPVLLSGDHSAIARWRREQSLRRTAERRPDLLPPSPSDTSGPHDPVAQ
jgi:tRNA (guanine37-N1)-methyltransferase